MIVPALLLAFASTPTAAPEAIQFNADNVTVHDVLGRPLFRSSRDFLLQIAKNPNGQVIRYDSPRRRVLVSTEGAELWVRCADLKPMASACHQRAAVAAMRAAAKPMPAAAAPPMRGIPACPGDPRCPKQD